MLIFGLFWSNTVTVQEQILANVEHEKAILPENGQNIAHPGTLTTDLLYVWRAAWKAAFPGMASA
jgi:hypothetical protein